VQLEALQDEALQHEALQLEALRDDHEHQDAELEAVAFLYQTVKEQEEVALLLLVH